MNRKSSGRVLAWVLLVCSVPLAASAQERGRTDGPEGSEYGKGGYADPGGGLFSLTLSWGASIGESRPLGQDNGAPLFVGLTGTLWLDDWFLFDISPAFLLNSNRTNLLIGPRFRTIGYPLSFTAGLQAGGIIDPDTGLRFGLSPNVGVDTVFNEHIVLGLQYALDLPIGGDGLDHRIFMNVGYRF